MIGKLDDALRFYQTTLGLRAQRQQVLASNIANADTPNYKARDIDFKAALQNALEPKGATPAGQLAKTDGSHLNAGGTGSNGVPMLYRTIQQGNVDGNTVDMDVERNQFTDNAMRYEADVAILGTKLRTLLAAVQG